MPAKLLIAEDSTTIQKVFERTFSPEEFTLSFANNGEEALAKARTESPQLIIADINMPLKNGFEVCAALKQDPALKGIPVLLLIGILDDFDEDESRRVGADGFIVKPFEANAAISKVREALSKGGSALPPQGPAAGQAEEIMDLADIVTEPATAPPQKKGAEDIVDLADIVPETPGAPTPLQEKAEEIMELADIMAEPATAPPQEKGAEDIFELPDIAVETPRATPPPSPQVKKEDEGFVLQTPLRELEEELKAEFPEEQAGLEEESKVEFPEEKTGLEQDLGAEMKAELPEEEAEVKKNLFVSLKEEDFGTLELDLPFDEQGLEPQAKDADWTGLFDDLGIDEPGQEAKNERLGTILDESTSELKKIEGLGTLKDEKPEEETFTKKFREPFFGENALEPEKIEGLGTPKKREGKEEEFAEKFMEDFEPVFEPDEDLEHIDILEKDLSKTATEGTEDLAERVTSAVGHELKEAVEELIKDKVPKLVRQEMNRLKKE